MKCRNPARPSSKGVHLQLGVESSAYKSASRVDTTPGSNWRARIAALRPSIHVGRTTLRPVQGKHRLIGSHLSARPVRSLPPCLPETAPYNLLTYLHILCQSAIHRQFAGCCYFTLSLHKSYWLLCGSSREAPPPLVFYNIATNPTI